MFKQYLGYSLLIIAFISYKLRDLVSRLIPNFSIFIICIILLVIFGVYLIFLSYIKAANENKNHHQKRVTKLKVDGEKIILNPDNCIVKENNYYEEKVDNSFSRIAVADSLYEPNRNVTQNYKEQTAIIFYYKNKGKEFRLTSQTFPFNAERLNTYLMKGSVKLYVSRLDKNDYAFDLEE